MEPPRQINETERQAVRVVQQNLTTQEGRTYEHVSSMFRWLLATLFTANGGAIVALLGKPNPPTRALDLFAAGMVISLLMGVASTLGGLRISTRLNNARVIAEQMLLDGVDRGEDLQARLLAFKTTWRSWIPGYLGVASLVCLIAGIFAA